MCLLVADGVFWWYSAARRVQLTAVWAPFLENPGNVLIVTDGGNPSEDDLSANQNLTIWE